MAARKGTRLCKTENQRLSIIKIIFPFSQVRKTKARLAEHFLKTKNALFNRKMMAIERPEHTIRHGWLKKKGEKRKNWNRRYVFLNVVYLRYYDRDVLN